MLKIDDRTLTAAEQTLASNIDVSELSAALESSDPASEVNALFKKEAARFHDGTHEPEPVRKELVSSEPATPGARVRLIGLLNKPELNNRIGTVVKDRSDKQDGRIAVAVDGLAGAGIRIKAANLSVNDAVVRVRDGHQRRVLAKQVVKMDTNARKGGRLDEMQRVLNASRAHKGLPLRKYGDSRSERLDFWDHIHQISGSRPDFASAGVFVSEELRDEERAMLREAGYNV